MKQDQVALTRSWRRLSGELSVLLDLEDFHEKFPGAAANLAKYMESMQVVVNHSTVQMTPDVVEAEERLLDRQIPAEGGSTVVGLTPGDS